ncbi:MAG TPA: 3'-5' exonuclease [Opitutae bacterium]|nr:3'-5' exonuclease [Opitutae bacterium]
MFSTPIHVIDFEGSRQSGVVEYGVVTLHGEQIEATYSRLCAPVGTISDRDRLQHGISEELAAQEARFDTEWELFAGLRESGPLCAHNVAVEDGLLRNVWPYPRSSPDFLDEGQTTASWGPWVDTLQLYRRIYPQLVSYKLGDLIQLFDLEAALAELAGLYCPEKRGRYHCALYDALASALLLRRLYHEPDLGELTLRWLLVNSAASTASRDALGQQDLF